FQMIGVTYILGNKLYMPLFLRDAIDAVAGPTTFFVGATLAFMAALRYRRFVANGLVAWSLVNLFLLYFGLSMTDYDFRDIVTKADNVPIVAPNPSKAPWYFLGLQEMLVYFDPWMAGVVLPSMIIVGLMAIPYIDTNKAGNGYFTFNERKFAWITFQYGFVVLWVVLILLGTF